MVKRGMRRGNGMHIGFFTVLWTVLGSVCLVYGAFVRAANSGTRFWMIWFALAAGFAVLAFLAARDTGRRMAPGWRTACIAAVCVCLAFFLTVEGLILSGFREKGRPGLDALIVLGAQVYASGPARVLRFRLDAAAAYLEENPDCVCVVCGGQGWNEPCPEADVMARYLEEKGIAASRIIREDKSATTAQNLAFAMALLPKDASVGIVTNGFHMYRALYQAREQGIREPVGIAAGASTMYLPTNLLREFFAVVKHVIL